MVHEMRQPHSTCSVGFSSRSSRPALAGAPGPLTPWMTALAVITGALVPAWAGGPVLVTSDGQPYRLDQSQTARYAVDNGAFGARSHAWAVAAIEKGYRAWQESPG